MKKKHSNMKGGELFACAYTLRSSHRRCSTKNMFLKFRKIYRKIPVLKSLFNSYRHLAGNFDRKRVQQKCFLVNSAKKIKNTGQLLLENFLFKLIRQTFIHGRCIISDPVYKKDCARNFVFSGL